MKQNYKKSLISTCHHQQQQQPSLPCFQCHPTTYIRLVQHLIERCLLLKMERHECIQALAKHAKLHPLITLTVWRGLQKENTEFFQAYSYAASPRPNFVTRFHTRQRFGRRFRYRRY